MAKRSYKTKKRAKNSKRVQNKKSSFAIKWLSFLILFFIFGFAASYYILSTKATHPTNKILVDNNKKIRELQKLLEKTKKELKTYKEIDYLSEIEDLKSQKEIKHKKTKHINKLKPHFVKKLKHTNKPKLVIIIDDVVTKKQVKRIKATKLKITMSFIPPIAQHPNSAKIAKNLKHIMIHLPLEAYSHRFVQEDTLLVADTKTTINKRIKEVHRLYPTAKYINNHTGSKFTSDINSMIMLLNATRKNKLFFVDSRTSKDSKAVEVANRLNMPILSRDIFLDNKPDKKYIQKQLKKAIKKAKKYGYAIAIGHPHPITIKTLKESTSILKDIKLLYIDELL